MAAITVRNLSEETHRALKARAASHHRSTEAEVRAILESAVAPSDRVHLGSVLLRIGQEAGGVELDDLRDPRASEPPTFE
ncbi:FitA-like ribbon-helix-helix domain-containing protein [Microlunatus speluncae]|uniref:FitA-like ribbon-helix-helix domain-containing protein n=1 Tax=Microlunatus speluncae TaxID=2594267 RepID=UPI00126651A3